jgi:cell division protein ZapE
MKLTNHTATALKQKHVDDLLIESYQISLDAGELEADTFQKTIVLELQQVYNTVITLKPSIQSGFLSKLFSSFSSKPHQHPIKKGLYLWGGVGRGKTLLVDYFFNLLPTDRKLRLHFHRFMQLVHEELATLKHISNPLKAIANKLSDRVDLLCLDEMHVNDITDAMLLGTLFNSLFEQGVILVTTSNYHPEDLYKDGLQRERFLPTIALLESHTKIVRMEGEEDYRLKTLGKNTVYHLTHHTLSEQHLECYFHQLSGIERHQDRQDIIIKQRKITVKMWADGVVWLEFDQICDSTRSTEDYSQIANIFHTVLISNIVVMDVTMDDIARRFINMIDVFYDLRVNLVASAQTIPEKLYTGKCLTFEFERTASRLREMQTAKYMAIRHLS